MIDNTNQDDNLQENPEIVKDWQAFIKPYLKYNLGTNEITGPIYIYNKIFELNSDLDFSGTYRKDFTFKNCHFNKGISFKGCKFHKKFYFVDCTIEGAVSTFDNPHFGDGLFILQTSVNQILISKGEYGISNFTLKTVDHLSITGGTFTSLEISIKEKVGHIKIAANQINGDVFIDGCNREVRSANLSGTAKDLSLFINNIQIFHLALTLYVNENRLKLSNIKGLTPQSNILVSNCQLGKTEFSSIDFNQFNMVVFDESNLTECSFNNVSWSDSVFGAVLVDRQEETDEKHKIFNLKSRETYRQLKHAMSKQGDVINEQKFHSKEMVHHLNGLGKGSWGTKAIIVLSYWTSDFGQSIGRPLFFLFLFHTILFVPLLLWANVPWDFQFSFSDLSSQAFWKGFHKYFFLMNPIRKVEESEFPGFWIVVDLFMRICSSYMLYNIIRATRRFIK